MNQKWICPECGSDHVDLLTIWEGNPNPLGCQGCYYRGDYADFLPKEETESPMQN